MSFFSRSLEDLTAVTPVDETSAYDPDGTLPVIPYWIDLSLVNVPGLPAPPSDVLCMITFLGAILAL